MHLACIYIVIIKLCFFFKLMIVLNKKMLLDFDFLCGNVQVLITFGKMHKKQSACILIISLYAIS